MREIKLRAWIKAENKNGEYVKPMTINFKESAFSLDRSNDLVDFEQFTGLKDKYGVEIYEGDIIHGYDQEPDRYDGYIGSSVVEVVNFVDGAFWLGNIENQIMLCTPPIIEIVGNIHENADLLEALKNGKI